MTTINVSLPNDGWRPRPDQLKLWAYHERGGKRSIEIAHRRWGKDDVALHWTAIAANDVQHPKSRGRIGSYWHMLPSYTQSRKAIWDAINPRTGKRRIDEAFPSALIEDRRETDMFIRFKTGSTWQVIGSDNYNALVGTPPIGLVGSEWALSDPNAWEYLSPILEENGGWAMFISTPRGRGHAYKMLEHAKQEKSWFWQVLSAADTPVFTQEQLMRIRRERMDLRGDEDGDALFQQEYMCSFDAPQVGAFYARLIAKMETEGRVVSVLPVVKNIPVETAWDLGYADDTAIWFYQVVDGVPHILDYYANHGHPPSHYAGIIDDKAIYHGWYYYWDNPHSAMHWVPWDARPKTLASGGKSLLEIFWEDHGLQLRVSKQLSVADGIMNTKKMLQSAVFHERCKAGLEALRDYHREWDDERKCFFEKPAHTWASHGADAARIMAINLHGRIKHVPSKIISKLPIHLDVQAATFDDLVAYNSNHRREERY